MNTGPRGDDLGGAFTGRISTEGQIVVPPEIAGRLRRFAGSPVAVRLTEGSLAAALQDRGVEAEEVDRVAAAQLESREIAARFLLSEGALRAGRRRKARP